MEKSSMNGSGRAGFRIEVRSADEFRCDQPLHDELRGILADAYENPSAFLDRELEVCDTLLLARDEDRRPAAFLLIHFGGVATPEGSVPLLYAGPAAERGDLRGSGCALGLPLYVAQNLLDPSVDRYLFCSDTMSGAGYLATSRALPGLEPRPDGGYSERGAALARSVRGPLGYPAQGDGHPFVLHGLYPTTRLNAAERDRDRAIIAAHELALFDRLLVERDAGDAVLLLGWFPPRLSR